MRFLVFLVIVAKTVLAKKPECGFMQFVPSEMTKKPNPRESKIEEKTRILVFYVDENFPDKGFREKTVPKAENH